MDGKVDERRRAASSLPEHGSTNSSDATPSTDDKPPVRGINKNLPRSRAPADFSHLSSHARVSAFRSPLPARSKDQSKSMYAGRYSSATSSSPSSLSPTAGAAAVESARFLK